MAKVYPAEYYIAARLAHEAVRVQSEEYKGCSTRPWHDAQDWLKEEVLADVARYWETEERVRVRFSGHGFDVERQAIIRTITLAIKRGGLANG